MKIEHNGQVLNGMLQDGYWTFYLVTEGDDDVQLLPDPGCEGQTQFTEIQLEYGEERTIFEAPTVVTGDLTGMFKQISDLAFVVLDEETGLSTRLFQLGGAWAVQNLNGNGDIISQINLIEDMARIQARFIHLNGTSLIDDAVIKNAHIESMTASKLTAGTIDALKINVVNLNASNINAGHGEFLSIAMTDLNSQAKITPSAIRITNADKSFIELNNVPEVRTTSARGASAIMGDGRIHFFNDNNTSLGYVGADRHDGTNTFGTYLSKGIGAYRFSRMANAQSVTAKYHVVKNVGGYPQGRVAIITELVQRGELPDGDAADFVRKSNMIAALNGWRPLPVEWPTLSIGQQIKYQEEVVTGSGDAYDDIWKFGPSTQGDWRIYFLKHARFEGGFTDVSDRRVKYDIEPTKVKALNSIDAFDFKGYKMLSDDREIDLGLIAQEAGILRVADDELEGIDIQKGIMLALKGVQELHTVVKEQAEIIKRLKEELNEKE